MSHPDNDPFQLSPEEFLRLLAEITRRAVQRLIELPYASIDRVDDSADIRASDITPALEQQDLIDGLIAARDDPFGKQDDRASNYGEQAAFEDGFIHDFVFNEIHDELADIVFAAAGEESDTSEWSRFLEAPAGCTVLLVDAVDGTHNMRTTRTGFSCNIAVYSALGGGHFELLAGVATNQSLETQIFNVRTMTVQMLSPSGRIVTIAGVSSGSERAFSGTYAAVASRPQVRKLIARLIDPDGQFQVDPKIYGGTLQFSEALTFYSTAGAPLMISWPFGGLEYLHVVHDQSPYDAAPIVGCLVGGGSTYYLASTGQAATLRDVVFWLGEVTGPQGANPRPLPAGILVRDTAKPETTAAVLRLVQEIHRELLQGDSANAETTGSEQRDADEETL